MNLALRMTKQQMLLLAIIFVVLLATALLVIHTSMPEFWHVISLGPNVIIRQP